MDITKAAKEEFEKWMKNKGVKCLQDAYLAGYQKAWEAWLAIHDGCDPFERIDKLQAENEQLSDKNRHLVEREAKLLKCVRFIAGYVNAIQACESAQQCLKELGE